MNRGQLKFNLTGELIVDCFAGGGGASIGIENGTGCYVDIAINHDPEAVAMHRLNHPMTRHYIENIWDVEPRKVTAGLPVGWAHFSPDCKHFSKAKGGKPVEKKIRGLAWVILKWVGQVRPRIISMENVEEFTTWGPLIKVLDANGKPKKDKNGRVLYKPDRKRKGQTFQAFVNALRRHGYAVEWKELRACDYGAPTTRKRLFLIARSDGRSIIWPEPTHGPHDNKNGLLPYHTAAECIDWTIPCPSIFERKKPLAENTLRRIARGIQKYVIDAERPFIVTCNHSGNHFRGQGVDEPFKTICASHDAHGLVMPYVTPLDHQSSKTAGDPVSQPLTTITSKARHLLVSPTLVQTGYGEREGQKPRCMDVQAPLNTVVAGGQKHALVAASLLRHFGRSIGGPVDTPMGTITAGGGGKSALITSNLVKLRGTSTAASVDQPMPTITAGGMHIAEVRAFLIKYYGNERDGVNLNDPCHTVTTKDRFGLVTVAGVDYIITDIGLRMLEPHELYAAQGFPDDYTINFEYTPGKMLTKKAQVRMVGNSVSPPVLEAIVKANWQPQATQEGVAV